MENRAHHTDRIARRRNIMGAYDSSAFRDGQRRQAQAPIEPLIDGPAQKSLNRFSLTVKNGQISIA